MSPASAKSGFRSRGIFRRVRAFAFVAGVFVFFILSGPLHAFSDVIAARPACHVTNAGCPDSDHEGHHCGPACPCACCPGHAVSIVGTATVVGPIHLPPVDFVTEITEPQPAEYVFRIFRPPRA